MPRCPPACYVLNDRYLDIQLATQLHLLLSKLPVLCTVRVYAPSLLCPARSLATGSTVGLRCSTRIQLVSDALPWLLGLCLAYLTATAPPVCLCARYYELCSWLSAARAVELPSPAELLLLSQPLSYTLRLHCPVTELPAQVDTLLRPRS